MSKLIRAILIIAIGLFAPIANSVESLSFTVVKGTDKYRDGSTLNAEDAIILEEGQSLTLQVMDIMFELKGSEKSNSILDVIIPIIKMITSPRRSLEHPFANLGSLSQVNIHKDNHFCYTEGTDSLEFWRSEAQRDNTQLTLKKGETEKPFEWRANQQTISIPLAEIGEGEYKLTVTADKSEAEVFDETITFHKLPNIQGNIDQLVNKGCIRQAAVLFTTDPEYKFAYTTQP